MTQNERDLLIKDLCARLPYNVKIKIKTYEDIDEIDSIGTLCQLNKQYFWILEDEYERCIEYNKPYLLPLSSMTDEDHAIYSKIWEDTGKTAYLEGCHHLISTIKAYKAANDFLLSKHYDINGLIPKDLANDATGLNIY